MMYDLCYFFYAFEVEAADLDHYFVNGNDEAKPTFLRRAGACSALAVALLLHDVSCRGREV